MDLDVLIARVECVLFDVDGPVCAVFAGHPARDVAAVLRAHLPNPIPAEVETTNDPLQVLAHALTLGGQVAEDAEAAMSTAEDQAMQSATATPGAAEAIDAARRSGRRVGFVSNNSAQAVAGYLADHGLIRRGDIVSARAPGNAGRMKPDPYLVTQAINALNVQPGRAVLVGDSPTDITAAHATGAHAIGYANKPGKSSRLANAAADAVISDMHDLAHALNTRPVRIAP